MNVVKTFTTQSFTIFPNFLDLYTRLVSNQSFSCQRLGSRIRMLLFAAACSSPVERGERSIIKRRKKDSRLHTLHSRTPPRDSRPPANRRGALLCLCSALLFLTVSQQPAHLINLRFQPLSLSLSPFDLCLARLFELVVSCLTAPKPRD